MVLLDKITGSERFIEKIIDELGGVASTHSSYISEERRHDTTYYYAFFFV